MFSLLLPMVVGAAGLGAETSYWYYRRLQLQSAVDAAAYAGAVAKRAGQDNPAIIDTATDVADQNGYDPATGTITVNAPPTSGAFTAADAVEVIIDSDARRFFTSLFSTQAVHMHARSVAFYQTAQSACVLALAPAASRALQVSGSGDLNVQGCSVMANSIAPDAVNVQGSAAMSADCVISGGGIEDNGGIDLTNCDEGLTNQPPAADPYKNLPAPPISGPCKNDNQATLDPGDYCHGMTINSTKTLTPGVYIIRNGDLTFNANADVTGSGVTFYLVGTARVKMNGNAYVNVSAPTSGTYSGILFFGDRSNVGGDNIINGTAASHLTGVFYFPTQNVSYQGNYSGMNGCTQVVAATVQWTGNSTVAVNCTAMGFNTVPIPGAVRMAE